MLTREIRARLARPLSRIVNEKELMKLVNVVKPTMIITVGDVVTATLIALGREPEVAIFDFKTKREESRYRFHYDIVVNNPRSSITDEAMEVIKEAIRRHRRVKVEGEEDLLALPAVLYAPERSIVIYGQPDEGMVPIVVEESVKKFVERIIEAMPYFAPRPIEEIDKLLPR